MQSFVDFMIEQINNQATKDLDIVIEHVEIPIHLYHEHFIDSIESLFLVEQGMSGNDVGATVLQTLMMSGFDPFSGITSMISRFGPIILVGVLAYYGFQSGFIQGLLPPQFKDQLNGIWNWLVKNGGPYIIKVIDWLTKTFPGVFDWLKGVQGTVTRHVIKSYSQNAGETLKNFFTDSSIAKIVQKLPFVGERVQQYIASGADITNAVTQGAIDYSNLPKAEDFMSPEEKTAYDQAMQVWQGQKQGKTLANRPTPEAFIKDPQRQQQMVQAKTAYNTELKSRKVVASG